MAVLIVLAIFGLLAYLFNVRARDSREEMQRRFPSTPYSEYPPWRPLTDEERRAQYEESERLRLESERIYKEWREEKELMRRLNSRR